MFAQHTSAVSALSERYPVLGLALTTHRSTRSTPMQFADKPYLVELYADARHLEHCVVRKAVQTGVSEWLLQAVLDAAGWRGRICAYVLPSYKVRNRFVQQRVDRLLVEIGAYRDRCPGGPIGEATTGAENLSLKRFGTGALLFLGSETETDFVELSADVLVVDEYDLCNPTNIALAGNRLRESPYPQVFHVGNPTLPRQSTARQGIAAEYDDSDRRRWYHRCGRCSTRQALDWFQHVVERDDAGRWVPRDRDAVARGVAPRPICVSCRDPFERRAEGAAWIAENPGHVRRGYAMSRLDVLSDSVGDLYAEWVLAQGSPDLLRAFYTGALGIPYEFEGAKLTVAMLDACCAGSDEMDHAGGDTYGKAVVTAGIDVGAVLHVTVSVVTRDAEDRPIRTARHVTTVPTFESARDIVRRFRVEMCVMDAAPEYHKAREFRDWFSGDDRTTIWLCNFHPTPRIGTQKYGLRQDHQSHVVTVDRTAVFDVSHEDIVSGRRRYPSDCIAVRGWSEQMRAPIRVHNEERGRIEWTKGVDHFRLSDCYDRIACDLVDLGGRWFA